MAIPASSFSSLTASLAWEPEPLPVTPRLERPLEVAQCSLCGIALPLGLLVPDGGEACADVRWYCKDARSCTERWTTARPPHRAPTEPAQSLA